MKLLHKYLLIPILLIVISYGIVMPSVKAAGRDDMKTIPEWSILWGDGSETVEELISTSSNRDWITVKDLKSIPGKPDNVSTAWVRVQLPILLPEHYGFYISEIYSQHLWVYIENQLIDEIYYRFPYDVQRILLPINQSDAGKTIYLKMETSKGRLGINSSIQIEHFSKLLKSLTIGDVSDIILGFAFIFIAIIMLICSLFLKRTQLHSWVSLSMIILTIGFIFVTFSPSLYANFMKYGRLFIDVFDISLAILLPTLSFYIEKIYENEKLTFLRRFRKFQMMYSIFSLISMVINHLYDFRFAKAYFFISVTLLGYIILFQLIVLIGFSILYAVRGNKDAILLSLGFALTALMGVLDLIWYYISSQTYQIFLWKWGVIGFIIALIIILGRRFAAYQEFMMNYSKELEFYNQQLQLSEKMEMISSLAASVAHEVRNPLQVTRGFLQLVAGRTDDKNKEYMGMAIEELDRASQIITEFLMFAKPQMDELIDLNISQELKQIEGIILPLATLHGGSVVLNIPQNLYIRGNSSKLKQAFMNIIKNSIEAFREDGQVNIWAYEQHGEIFIHIKDNGEGIDSSKLARLGEPYFSTKKKGTGLGLMVTFRIIEAMKGRIIFNSQKNVGTEVVIRFPSLTSF
ncbi:sensor histidine kinase [Paenibacillus sedimenti]|uniref:histidine kinase n=1 Tax=Paenibacillus sedimenti TaxID=2770274 RepID=A0A926QLJ7_9BACL|nr:HAMP domain-containing sensor histidine kinase [Paenibacillus sedimenti]MBD0382662.1 HAMP domain-containing histidine kinase [Paenibacillus sedimenti]